MKKKPQLFFEDRSDLPLQDDVLARLLTFPNVIITAHQAFLPPCDGSGGDRRDHPGRTLRPGPMAGRRIVSTDDQRSHTRRMIRRRAC